jgi:CubicO group peptidase (beta-lactamase class C family)
LSQRQQITALVDDARGVAPLAGVSVGVFVDGAVFRGAWGQANTDPRRDVTIASTYRIASITKTFTAILALQLEHEGALDLDADVRGYVSTFPAKRWPIPARALLSHTSGILHYRSRHDALTTTPMTTAQSLALFADRPLAFAPGARFTYSSFGYVLLGAAIEGASHQRFADLLDQRILRPLAMDHTRLEAGPRGDDDVEGFRVRGGRLVQSDRLDISSRFASGGARSTVDDLLRYGHALLAGTLVDDDTWRRMTTPVVTRDGRQADYGLGFAVYPLRGRAVVAHAGGQPEVSSLLLLVPERDVAIVLLANVEGQGPELHHLAAAILEVVLDDGLPQRDLYADDVVDALVYQGLRRAFSYGLAAAPVALAPGAPQARAFAAFGSLLSRTRLRADPATAREAIGNAHHPSSGRIPQLVGAEMARLLIARGADRDDLVRGGPLAFFSAYADACASDVDGADAACACPLPPALVVDVRRLQAAWQQTPPQLLRLRPEDVGDHLDALRPLIGRPLHPSFRNDLERAATKLRHSGRRAEAQEVLALSTALHPRAAPAKETTRPKPATTTSTSATTSTTTSTATSTATRPAP